MFSQPGERRSRIANTLTDAKGEDWSEPRQAGAGQPLTLVEWVWTLFGLVLLVTFILLVVDDFPLRGALAAH
jgi:hypothetical protein